MARYIDADFVANGLREHLPPDDYEHREALDQLTYAISILQFAPTADVAPVVHAHWIEKVGMQPTGQHGEHYCSACCGCALRGRPGSGRDIQTKFCPHCGAKMDEENTQETHKG